MKICPVKLEDKVELFIDIFGSNENDLPLRACRITFKEIGSLYQMDTIGSGLFTMSMDEARSLNDQLATILDKEEGE